MRISPASIRETLSQSLHDAHNFLVDHKKTILITTLVLSALGLAASLGVAGSIYASGAALSKYALTFNYHTWNYVIAFAGLTPAGHTAVCATIGAVASTITGAFAAGALVNNHPAPTGYESVKSVDDE